MTKTNTQRIHRIYSILLSIVIVLAGILLMVSCLNIYNSGEEPYSRESVAKAFSNIALPIYICLGMLAISFIIDFFSPFSMGKVKNTKAYNLILNRLVAKRDINSATDLETVQKILAERKRRKLNKIVTICLLSILSIVFLIYAVNTNNYHQTLMNESMIKAMRIFVPCIIISFAAALYTVYYADRSVQREIELLKLLPEVVYNKEKTRKCNLDRNTCIRIAVLAIAIFLLVFGFINGGSDGVLGKAIAICTECIGLG